MRLKQGSKVLFLALVLALTACGPAIKDTVITSENKQEVIANAMDSQDLTGWEKQLLMGAQIQEAFGPLGGNYTMNGKTVKQVIKEAQERENNKQE